MAEPTTDPAVTVTLARFLAYAVVGVGAGVLLAYLVGFVRDVAVEPDVRSWTLLGLGIGAALVYGVAGAANTLGPSDWLAAFAEGATLFFILFLALAVRQLYYSGVGAKQVLPTWVDTLVVATFVGSWWTGFLLDQGLAHLVVVVGWIGASLWALGYGVLAVRHNEGTSIAALVRNLLPAVVAVTGVVFADVLGTAAGYPAVVDAVWLVGTVLVGTFLFTTAVAIRQQGGEVERMYDWTTWRGERLSDDGSQTPAGD